MNAFFDRFKDPLVLLGRLLIAAIFVSAGYSKIGGYAATQGYMESMGVPGALLPLVIFAELGGGIAIVLGLLTRLAALGLAVFSVASGVIFHGGSADQIQQIMFAKNLAIAGGFLFLVANGAGRLSLDAKLFGTT
ncbi:DoxX family protein [Solimonas sp. SE-A11]|uniref:DoxX family protein n=1 Tax=Solimonas sp. SE-A11 TaxID=3054954 RepID=UPI00259CFB9E|nr:DoxX family protein [Solimonas sp. SE-A11]MDM4770257.1 DoxX family protein [Solimonas sp. SE-A11]